MTSWLYRNGRVYRGVLRLLYGQALPARERLVAGLVPAGASVIDVCCGDATIAKRLGRDRYLGVDASPIFVRAMERAGIAARLLDVTRDDPPPGDVVLLLGALYQFLPDADALIERLRRSARQRVVIAEPYRNLAQHPWRPVRALARRMTDPGVDSSRDRFDETSLRALLERHGATEIHRTSRELVAALPGLSS